MNQPTSYTGLQGFHKYWGKKPTDTLSTLIQRLCPPNGVVVDPFLGSGLLTRSCRIAGRRFVGIDINPVSTELGRLFHDLPDVDEYRKAIDVLSREVRSDIEKSYVRSDGSVGTHFFWNETSLESVWTREGRGRVEYEANSHDKDLTEAYTGYVPKHLREIRLFTNSRINSTPRLSLGDLFKSRALANIDRLLDRILKFDDLLLRRALLLTLTAASGQMSNLVFAISKRGKTTNTVRQNAKVEVGSWAIGLWRPKKHFEINVWRCFLNRAQRLKKAIENTPQKSNGTMVDNIEAFFRERAGCALITTPCQSVLKQFPPSSVDLILTDPPHSDRMPYLELSEFWNSFLQYPHSDFENEIVISNACERGKDTNTYLNSMTRFMQDCVRIIKQSGFVCVMYNSADLRGWEFLRNPTGLNFLGCFNLNYSARSIVQDNRKGAMKNDYVLVYSRSQDSICLSFLDQQDGWSTSFPR